MNIIVESNLKLELINESHASSVFEMIDRNRDFLKQWLSFIPRMQSVEFIQEFIKGSIHRNSEGVEYAFVIFENEIAIGRIGIYKIDSQNKIGEIGYWLVENAQGRGIVSSCCKALIRFCFNTLPLNRIEIKCGVENKKSQSVPERLHFTCEGKIRQGEWLNNKFIDLNLFSLLKSEWKE